MEAKLLRPDPDHTPQWDESCYDVGDDELEKYDMISAADPRHMDFPPLTILFVGIFQYLWMYQKPPVLCK